jgi:ribose transport system ATP-binding protein
MATDSLLEVQALSKSFPGTKALREVNFDLKTGEIHALVGENGAGKTTLMHVLAGVHKPDSGSLLLGGLPTAFHSPEQSMRQGISIVHQELALFSSLSVAENIFVDRLPRLKGGVLWTAKLRQETQALLDTFHIKARPETLVQDLGPGDRQLVEIARAVSRRCRILILDEPTSSLDDTEAEVLFKNLRALRETGVSSIYISHKLPEVFGLSDRITVLRDGARIGTVMTSETNVAEIVHMMVGRNIEETLSRERGAGSHELLKVQDISRGKKLAPASFTLSAGEILGVYGLVGAGRTELARVLFGIDQRDGGQVFLDQKPVLIRNPTEAIRNGIVYLSEDRKVQGLFLRMNIAENISAGKLDQYARHFTMNEGLSDKEAEHFIQLLQIRAQGPRQKVNYLSGGNQQKVMIAKWLAMAPKVLIVDEPTRGVDVGAKAEIHSLLLSLAREGMGIIAISSELPEILTISHRIMVMREGRIAGVFGQEEATAEKLGACAVGQHGAV